MTIPGTDGGAVEETKPFGDCPDWKGPDLQYYLEDRCSQDCVDFWDHVVPQGRYRRPGW